MGDLLTAEPLEIASLGVRLMRAASAVADLRPVALPSSWRGRTAEVVGGRLCAVSAKVPRIERAYDDSGRALLLYARAAEDAQSLARKAADLRREADRLSALSPMPGPDPGDALRMTAARWEAEAQDLHDAAARRAIAVLDEVAASAPPARRRAAGERFRADLGTSVWSQVSGLAGLVVTAGEALGGNRAARDELVSVAKESWRVWEPFVDLYQQLDDGRGGLAVGSSLGFIGAKGAIRPGRPSAKGTHDLVDDIKVARGEARQESRVRFLIDLLGVIRRPYRPGDQSIGIYAHEAMNGHAVRQHVAKSFVFLRWRADTDKGGRASSFYDARTAQQCLDVVLERHRADLDALALGPTGVNRVIEVTMPHVVGHGLRRGQDELITSNVARAIFRNINGGAVLVSIYPKVT
jgi:Bacterial CdiA-CT RNAse A domain